MPDRTELTRRQWLALSGAAALGAGPPSAAGQDRIADSPARGERGTPRNIIFMVADGMSPGVPGLAELFSQLLRARGTNWHALAANPRAACGLLQTDSLSSMVTDSSAASSAWASGSRIFNGAVNVLPDGTRLTPIAPLARDKGKSIGLVSTTTITHATPACFAAVQPKRADEHLIAPQYLDLVDVILGGGHEFFAADKRKDQVDLYERFRTSGYTVCRTRDELLAAPRDRKLLGCFSTGHMPFTIDDRNRPGDRPRMPSLAEMSRAALDRLSNSGGGFLLQMEGGRVDHAAHSNDAAAMLWEQLDFDEAIGVVLAFIEQNPDTLLIITTDHGNSNPTLIGIGPGYRDSAARFARLAEVGSSFSTIYAELRGLISDGQRPAADDVIAVMRAHTQITIEQVEAETIARTMTGQKSDDLHHQHRGIVGALGQTMTNHTGVAWTGTSHTFDYALTLALGPGSDRFASLMHHTDVYGVLTSFMGIDHKNPTMTAEEAKQYAALPVAPDEDLHWI
ncbi:MAG: alkaline phosphatase [Phycisphaerales bacterium]|nr:MAG: alkaline phosphatase [Phycisphaerales bacterium]